MDSLYPPVFTVHFRVSDDLREALKSAKGPDNFRNLFIYSPNNVGGFGDVEKAARVFARNELVPLQSRFEELNGWIGEEIVRFEKYDLEG